MTAVRVTLPGCVPVYADAGLWLKADPSRLEPCEALGVATRVVSHAPGALVETLGAGPSGAMAAAEGPRDADALPSGAVVADHEPASPAAFSSRGGAGTFQGTTYTCAMQQNGTQTPMAGSEQQ